MNQRLLALPPTLGPIPSIAWDVITGEYPPQPGGVSDYTRQVALGLVAAGDTVDVWAPRCGKPELGDRGVTVHRLPDRFGLRSLRRLAGALDGRPAPRRLLVQYVPQAFGWKGANLAFCHWLRSRRQDSVWVMFHEVMFEADRDRNLRRAALARVQRRMASLVAQSAKRAFMSIPGWRPMLDRLLPEGIEATWLPVPSGIPIAHDPAATAAVRRRYASGQALVGHFGTSGSAIRRLLDPALVALLERSGCHVLLLGTMSDAVCRTLVSAHPSMQGRVFGTGSLAPDDVSRHVAACDVMLQPYPDGISSRRTSAMVPLSHGRPIVTTSGRLTEPVWREAGAVVLAPLDPVRLAEEAAALLNDPGRRTRLGAQAAALYDARFHLRHVVAALRSP